MFACHQYDVCRDSVGSVYVGGYCSPRESGLCAFRELCPVRFLVVGESPSVLLLSVIMSYVNCGDEGSELVKISAISCPP